MVVYIDSVVRKISCSVYFWAFKSSIKLCIFFVIIVSITMYYDEEHSKLFTAFNHQVIKELLVGNIYLNGELFSEWLWWVEKGFRTDPRVEFTGRLEVRDRGSLAPNLQLSDKLDPRVCSSSNMAVAGRVAFHRCKVLISSFDKILLYWVRSGNTPFSMTRRSPC